MRTTIWLVVHPIARCLDEPVGHGRQVHKTQEHCGCRQTLLVVQVMAGISTKKRMKEQDQTTSGILAYDEFTECRQAGQGGQTWFPRQTACLHGTAGRRVHCGAQTTIYLVLLYTA